MTSAYIISAVRTPIGRFGGSFKDHSPVDLASVVMKSALERAEVSGGELDFYIFGNVLRAGHGQLIPRQAAMMAGRSEEHTSELQSRGHLVCRLLLEKKKKKYTHVN